MKFVSPDTCCKDYKKRRSAFLKELIASTPNVSMRAKEFRRWIDRNSHPLELTVLRPGYAEDSNFLIVAFTVIRSSTTDFQSSRASSKNLSTVTTRGGFR
jgi:hypothetical protein